MTDDKQGGGGQSEPMESEPEKDSPEDEDSTFPIPTMEVIEGHDLSLREYS